MRENRFVRNLVATPWIKLKGTIENGKFGDPNTTRVKHPSHLEMHISLAGKRGMNSYKQKRCGHCRFLFAIVLVLGMGFLMFAFSFTLVVVELTQYVAFSTSRSYMAAQQTPADQVANAKIKYQSLVQNPILAPLYNNGWYNVPLDAPKLESLPETVTIRHRGVKMEHLHI